MDPILNRAKSSGPPGFPSKGSQTAGNPWTVPRPQHADFETEDYNLFSSSLPVLPHHKLSFDTGNGTFDDVSAKVNGLSSELDSKNFKVDDIFHAGDGLPDEDEFLKGLVDDYEPARSQNFTEELEYDIFGGMELDFDTTESITMHMAKTSVSDGFKNDGINQYGLTSGIGTVTGEHPYGEHPSRTLFVRNINSNVEDSELRSLFEAYGDIRTLYTATKHRGFVMISYYDIRAARNAMRGLQNKPLRRRKLDIHFSIPKDNPSDKDLNQGTLVIFNLEPSVSNDDIRQIFGAYGEVKEIRETPHKRHHRFIEFYDARDAEAALKALNKSEIGGKRIKLEPSRPGGARRNLINQLSHDAEQDDQRSFRTHVGSPISSSPPGAWLPYGSPADGSSPAYNKSPTGRGLSPIGLSNSIMSNQARISPIGKELNRTNHSDHLFSGGNMSIGGGFQHSRSLSDYSSEFMSSSPGTLPSFGQSTSSGSAIGTLTASQFLWSSPKPYPDTAHSPSWHSASMSYSIPSNNRAPGHGLPIGSQQTFFGSSDNQNHHAVGSAPSGAPFQSHLGFLPDSPETSYMKQIKYGNLGAGQSAGLLMNMMGTHPILNSVGTLNGNLSENSSPNFRGMTHHRVGQHIYGSAPFQSPGIISFEALADRLRNRRVDSFVNPIDSKRQYQLDLEKIISGEDTRTTLMVKNIPNKYTSKMLLAAIDENHKGTYDFFYLPIDFKNKCNVGYAFINMVSPARIVPFFEEFNGKRWEKFNSEKVASLAYARIQGKAALISHFQNSSLLNEDKRCRPILFHSEGPDAGNQEPFPINGVLSTSPPLEDWASTDMDAIESSTYGVQDENGGDNLAPVAGSESL